ncbi:hypothetical protein EDD15DRAFT_797800 [Pisolithus albus]|nr:hypothetical protein EDD15DRAFT_797800 [Pisolithus albus]
MGSLSGARAVLAHLQRRELQLLQELSDVRKALAAQKVVLDELVKASAVPYIDRLPNELLAEIFLLCTDERRNLLMVSRRWRAVIFDTGRMWSQIYMLSNLTKRKLCLKRSREAPLTLHISDFIPEPDFFIPHANRWHTLSVFGFTEVTLSMISQIILPSLRHLVLSKAGTSLYDVPAMRSWAPALKHLKLIDWNPPLLHRPLSQIVPESLEELLITTSRDWDFEKDSMHFPSLRRLTLRIGNPIPFLEAIVAPKLAFFSFDPREKESISETFTGTRTKFINVSHLDLSEMCEVYPRSRPRRY